MEEPPHDPGGSLPNFPPIPIASAFVTISNESGMDTDCSIASAKNRKRTRTSKVCRHCNKKKRNKHSVQKLDDCCCTLSDNTNQVPDTVPTTSVIASKAFTENVTKTSKPAPIGRTNYTSTDVGPFVVHIQKIQSNINDSTSLHPIAFGKFLQGQTFKHNIVNGSLKRIGRNRITLAFTQFEKANEFLSHPSLIKNNFKAFVPTFQVTRMGVVRGIPTEWSDDEVLENITVPVGCGKIIKMRRFNYKTKVDGAPVWKPSQTVLLTFDGQVLPKRIFICYNAIPVELYTYPTIQCFSCARFGHTKTLCRSKPRCYKCGKEHTGDKCDIEESEATCCLCSGSHFATNKICPEYERQTKIKKAMAESSTSYLEASKLYPPVSKSYADIVNRKIVEKSESPSIKSYKKTITLKPRSPYQAPKGYDQKAHQALIKENSLPTSRNGCAYSASSSEQSISDVIMSLIISLSQSNIINHEHAAPLIEKLQNILHVHNECTTNCNQQT